MSRPSLYARGLDLVLVLARQSPWRWAAAAMCTACVLAQCAWLPHLRRERDEATDRVRTLRARHVSTSIRSAATGPAPSVSALRLKAFQEVLGSPDHPEELTRAMFDAARDVGLVLAESDYARVAEKSGAYQRLQVSQPVRGTYAQTRAYCDRILAAVPYAALDDLHFKREGVAVPEGEARVRWTFYLRSAPGAPPARAAEESK